MLAERIERIADNIWVPQKEWHRIMDIAAEVRGLERLVEELRAAEDILYSELRRLETREQARLSERAYSASPTGYGGLTVPVTSANHCSDWPGSHPECEERT